jgi:hypothetical protein
VRKSASNVSMYILGGLHWPDARTTRCLGLKLTRDLHHNPQPPASETRTPAL